MLRGLIAFSLRQPVVVLALAGALLLAGLRSLDTTPLDVFPEFAPPLVEIQTEAPGLSTEEVEGLVTVPLENALNGTPWLKTLRSKSVLGLSSVVLIFQDGTDLGRARQMVQERLAVEASRLPAVARPPVILSPLSSTSRVLKIGLWSDRLSQVQLSELARWTIRPRLMAVQGVANVAIWGQRDRQLQVLVDPERLRAHGVALDAVLRTAREATVVAGGGFLDTPNQRLPIRHAAAVRTPADLAAAVVDDGRDPPLTLGDVAEIVEGFPAPIGDAVINDRPGLLLIVEKQPWGNTLDVTRQVEAALETLRPALAGVEYDATIFRPATFIEQSLRNLSWSLWLGCALVLLVLGLFLFDWRTAAISATAIPLSLAAAFLTLRLAGTTINTMVLAGLVIALGEVVDDAIIDVENIVRRLRLNRATGNPRSAFRVVLNAALEVRSAVVFASLIVMLVFLPVFFLDGLAGSFFRPLALAYVLAILASLVVALTVTPALALLLLPGASDRRGESPLLAPLKARYRRLLPAFAERSGWVLGAGVAAVLLAAAALPLFGEAFLPKFQERDFLMHWVEKPGTSLEAMRRVTIRASRELRQIDGVRNFGAHLGRAEVADEVVGPNFTELWISLHPDADYQPTVSRVQEVVDGYPGLHRDLLTYLRERVKEVLSGASASIVVRVYGSDLAVLRDQAGAIERAIADVPGVADLKVEAQVLVPQCEVRMRPEAAAQFGLTAGDVRRAVETLVKGSKVGEVYERQMVFDVAVWGTPSVRRDLTALAELSIETPHGGCVPLKDVADLAIVPAPNEIRREGASRRIDVTCNVAGGDLGEVSQEIERRVRALEFPNGYHPEFLGEHAARLDSRNRILLLGLASLVGIVVLLYADFGSWRLVLLVLLSFPLALVGGVIGVAAGGGIVSLGSIVGFVTVLGIAARNGIMLVSHYQHLERREGVPFGPALVLRGAEERLAPILMTALTAGLGLVPLVLAGNRPGHEIEFPMALVILGGLASSTVLNLLLMPALYLRFGRSRRDAASASPGGLVAH
jgi:CzcA family heavy metal efflux pump